MHNPGRGEQTMRNSIQWLITRHFWRDTRGQDLIEYALMAGFVAVAAGAVMPGVASKISTIFSKVSSALVAGGG
jgi:pilus assembly protein Flp/PilA